MQKIVIGNSVITIGIDLPEETIKEIITKSISRSEKSIPLSKEDFSEMPELYESYVEMKKIFQDMEDKKKSQNGNTKNT